ncbi:MAG: hypothetical protein IE937_09030 [Gammaproteobacteria bacterium]|nr:hypothetical protein [Gammaproteobacteria bacterium]
MLSVVFKSLLKLFGAVLLLLVSTWSYAQSFEVGETVFVAFPAGNVKDDAFIVGKVTRITPQGNYQLAVEDYVEGHDYGSSCVPISKHTQDQGLGEGWQLWQDTTKLDKQRLEYVVPKESVMKLDEGKHFFIERNNLYIVFGRWKSDAPMLTVERLERAEREAKNAGLDDMLPALELAKLHRQSFYGENARPLYAFETIAPLNTAVEAVLDLLNKDKSLNKLWRANPRDWQAISESSRDYFLVDAIDKIVADARSQLYEEGTENADPQVLANLKKNLEKLKR